VLALHVRVTECCTGGGSATAVKFTPVTGAPLIVTDFVDGVNVDPDALGATTYDPFARPGKL
jgi:hypothetical protein